MKASESTQYPCMNARPATPSPAWDDSDLVAACIGGDADAWSALIAKYQRMIYSVALRYGAQGHDAADIFQQVCIELFSGLADLRNVESLRSWLLIVTSHQCLRWKEMRLRNDQRLDPIDDENAPIDIPDAAPLAADQMLRIEREQVLRETVDQLPSRCAEVIRMLFYGEEPLPYSEVARRLDLATGSIGFIRGRCIEHLRKLLADAGFV